MNSDQIKQDYKNRMLYADVLLKKIKANYPVLKEKLDEINRYEGSYQGSIYRFYHYSFKVYRLQEMTQEICDLLKLIHPIDKKPDFCDIFQEIIDDGKVGEFKIEHNKNWSKHTRPIVEAFLHAKYMLEMAVYFGDKLKNEKEAPNLLPQGWASLLELYNIR